MEESTTLILDAVPCDFCGVLIPPWDVYFYGGFLICYRCYVEVNIVDDNLLLYHVFDLKV